jgi:uncharacterized membrane protein
MSLYLIVRFLHIIGAAGLFAGLGIEGIVYSNLKNAEKVRQAVSQGSTLKIMRIVFGVSVILLLLPGIYLVISTWGWNAWVIIGLILLVALSGLGSATGKKLGMAIGSLRGSEESISPDIKKRIADPAIMKMYKIKITLAMGIIFIMTVKPDWTVSIISIAVSLLLGLLLNMPSKQKQPAKEELESA